MLQSVQSRKVECGTGHRCGVPGSWRVLLEDSDKPFPLLLPHSLHPPFSLRQDLSLGAYWGSLTRLGWLDSELQGPSVCTPALELQMHATTLGVFTWVPENQQIPMLTWQALDRLSHVPALDP